MAEFPKPSVTVDAILWRPGGRDNKGEVLLIQRANPPFQGMWALPGGFVDPNEPLEHAARRELEEETGVAGDFALVQCGAFGNPGRDPRGWTVGVGFCAKVGAGECTPHAGDDAAHAAWLSCADLPHLAFDHNEIVAAAFARLGVA